MRVVAFTALLALAACSQPAQPAASAQGALLANVPVCSGQPHPTSADHPYPASECKLVTPHQTFHVRFAEAQGDDNGTVSVDALGQDGAVAQTLREDNVSDYADPEAIDFDEDGHIDLEIPLIVGNDNRDLVVVDGYPVVVIARNFFRRKVVSTDVVTRKLRIARWQ